MKQLSRRDRNGTRSSEELRRRYKFEQIDYTQEEIDELKKKIITDDHLSNTSTNPVQNKVITEALNNKVNKESGKGLSSNDFTDELKNKLENQTVPTKVSELENDLYYATEDLIPTKVSELTNDSNFVSKNTADTTYCTIATANKKVPLGGTTGQILTKKSNSDNDIEWVDQVEVKDIVPIAGTDLNTKIGELIIGYGNECSNRPAGSQNGFFINLPHTGTPALYNKQFWFNRMNNCTWCRSMENGAWTEWKPIDEDMKKVHNLSSYKVSGLTILRSSCIEKNKRIVMDFVGTITMAANTTTVLFNLPEAIRPTQIKDFIVFGQTNNDDGYIGYGQISTTGSLQVRFNTAISSYIRFSVVYDLD